MRKPLVSMAALALAASAASAQVGEKPPEFDAAKWYNTPPLLLENLQGKAVMIEVFRTW